MAYRDPKSNRSAEASVRISAKQKTAPHEGGSCGAVKVLLNGVDVAGATDRVDHLLPEAGSANDCEWHAVVLSCGIELREIGRPNDADSSNEDEGRNDHQDGVDGHFAATVGCLHFFHGWNPMLESEVRVVVGRGATNG